ncbi:MAG: transposase [Burkholderiales bacterium]
MCSARTHWPGMFAIDGVKLMRNFIDSPEGRARYAQRFATVEPVFGNLRDNKGLNRFTLRGRFPSRCSVEALLLGAQRSLHIRVMPQTTPSHLTVLYHRE